MSLSLKVDWCSHAAASYATRCWHYSKSMPIGKTAKLGIWENGDFIGAIVFAYGANTNIGKPFNLRQTQIVELCRIAMARHKSPVSRNLSIALKMIAKRYPGLELIVSYADCDQSHLGIIYQASNWTYLGCVDSNHSDHPSFRVRGKVLHPRQVYSLWGRGAQSLKWLRANIDPNVEYVYTLGKHKYAYPMNKRMRKTLCNLATPYPKRASEVQGSGTPDSNRDEAVQLRP